MQKALIATAALAVLASSATAMKFICHTEPDHPRCIAICNAALAANDKVPAYCEQTRALEDDEEQWSFNVSVKIPLDEEESEQLPRRRSEGKKARKIKVAPKDNSSKTKQHKLRKVIRKKAAKQAAALEEDEEQSVWNPGRLPVNLMGDEEQIY